MDTGYTPMQVFKQKALKNYSKNLPGVPVGQRILGSLKFPYWENENDREIGYCSIILQVSQEIYYHTHTLRTLEPLCPWMPFLPIFPCMIKKKKKK